MDAIGFFNSDIVELPKERDEDDLIEYARRLFDQYRTQMQRIRNDSLAAQVITTRIGLVTEISARLIKCLEEYFRGHPVKAYQLLDGILKTLGPHFDMICPTGDMSNVINPLYRLRITEPVPFQRKDLFHIPFELRHIVASMRYSVPGLPALYLGGSTLVCHLELGGPDPNAYSVSRLEALPNTGLRVLNFGLRPTRTGSWINERPDEFTEFGTGTAYVGAIVATWPLLALCSIRKRHPNARFHAEYVIPQMVLQWITDTRQFHGIRYFSTHYKDFHDDPKTYLNYVFPARTVRPTGYCSDLAALFKVTEPITWSQAKTGNPSGVERPQYKQDGKLIDALEKEYGNIESVLLGMPTDAVTP